jgi:DNA mismatch repair MutL-like protein
VSHPVGTTVKAMNLFEKLPVRRQTAERESSKTLKKIHKLLRAYVLAKPTIRISFSVLKSKTRHQNFIYAPKIGAATVEDAARKVIERECVNQCFYISKEINGYEFEALLPEPSCDKNKVSGHGQYISIDNRPVSHSRGDLKKVCTAFKETIHSHDAGFKIVKDIFLCLNIKCPPGTYDINIEPAKDDLLFLDSARILAAARAVFTSLYPISHLNAEAAVRRSGIQAKPTQSSTHEKEPSSDTGPLSSSQTFVEEQNHESALQSKSFDFDYSPRIGVFDRTRSTNQPVVEHELQALDVSLETGQDGPNLTSTWGNSMYGYEEEELPLSSSDINQLREDLDEIQSANKNVETSNPWILAKMASHTRPRHAPVSLITTEQPQKVVTPMRRPDVEMPLHNVSTSSLSGPPLLGERSAPMDAPLLETLHDLGQTSSVPKRPRRQLDPSSQPRNSKVQKPFKLPSGSLGQAKYCPNQSQNANPPELQHEGQDIRTFFGEQSKRPRSRKSRPNLMQPMPAWSEDDSGPRFANLHNSQSTMLGHPNTNGSYGPGRLNNLKGQQYAISEGAQASFPDIDMIGDRGENFISSNIVNYFRNLEVPSLDHQSESPDTTSLRGLMLHPSASESETVNLRMHVDIGTSALKHASPTILDDLPRWGGQRVWRPLTAILLSEMQQWERWAETMERLLHENRDIHTIGDAKVTILSGLRNCACSETFGRELALAS